MANISHYQDQFFCPLFNVDDSKSPLKTCIQLLFMLHSSLLFKTMVVNLSLSLLSCSSLPVCPWMRGAWYNHFVYFCNIHCMVNFIRQRDAWYFYLHKVLYLFFPNITFCRLFFLEKLIFQFKHLLSLTTDCSFCLVSQPGKNYTASFPMKSDGSSMELVSPRIKSENHGPTVQAARSFGGVDPSQGGNI